MANSNALENDHDQSSSLAEESPERYLAGLRLALAAAGLGICLFLPTAEASIISTSLVTISEDLGDYDQSSWVVTAYLLTYTGFLVIWSKLANLTGLRTALTSCAVMFMAFSAGCGAARSINQLIILRAFQGIGGSGLYSVTTVGLFQLVPGNRYSQMNAVAAAVMAFALMLGPLIGGAISHTGNWRWIFYYNLPATAVALGASLVALPRGFPYHCNLSRSDTAWPRPIDWAFVKKADLVGAFMLLGASTLLVTALEEGGVQFAWGSATIVVFFVLSGCLWALFLLWGWYASSSRVHDIEPMFPRRSFGNRMFIGALLGLFISGVPLIVAVIELPQRYQLVNAASPLQAGVRLLAYAIALPVGIMLANVLTARRQMPFVYVLLLGALLQTAGFALISTLPNTLETWPGQYGYSVVAGLGIGLSAGTFLVFAPVTVEKGDQHLAVGLALQARMLGSAVGIAIANSILNNFLRTHLASVVPASQLDLLLQSTSYLALCPTSVQIAVREIYGQGFNWQMRATIAFCAAQVLVIFVIWKRPALRLSKEGALH